MTALPYTTSAETIGVSGCSGEWVRYSEGMPCKAASRKSSDSGSIARSDGRPAVEAWLDHVKPEHRSVVRRIGALILEALKAQVRVIFFAGNTLKPIPPLAAPPRARAVDVHTDAELDERQIKAWLKQAQKLPAWGRV
jgi:hypothetical protein